MNYEYVAGLIHLKINVEFSTGESKEVVASKDKVIFNVCLVESSVNSFRCDWLKNIF